MARQSVAKPKILTQEAINELIIDAIQDIKGKNIVKLDLRKLDDSPTNFFVICEGDSSTQIKAIADNIQKRLKGELGMKTAQMEGRLSANWVLLDYFYTVVHIFYGETRAFYDLEDLWSDAEFSEYQNL